MANSDRLRLDATDLLRVGHLGSDDLGSAMISGSLIPGREVTKFGDPKHSTAFVIVMDHEFRVGEWIYVKDNWHGAGGRTERVHQITEVVLDERTYVLRYRLDDGPLLGRDYVEDVYKSFEMSHRFGYGPDLWLVCEACNHNTHRHCGGCGEELSHKMTVPGSENYHKCWDDNDG
jgi:hypothetical protein